MVDDLDEILLSKQSEVKSLCRYLIKHKLETLVTNKKAVELHNNGSSWLQVSTNWLF